MLAPPKPDNEVERLAALNACGILDRPSVPSLNRLTAIARELFDVRFALISLVADERTWFLASIGGLGAAESPRETSFCGHGILSSDVFVVENALRDLRFADNPAVVGEPNVRFYAGQPLRGPSGHRLGTLCIVDDRPRRFDAERLKLLEDLARAVEDEIARLASAHREEELVRFQNSLEKNQRLLQVIARAQSDFIGVTERGASFDRVLRDVLELTDSSQGFIGEVLTIDGVPHVRAQAHLDLKASTVEPSGTAEEFTAFQAVDTLIGRALSSGRAVFSNEITREEAGSYREKSDPSTLFAAPIHHQGELVGILSVANRKPGYDASITSFLEPLVATLGQLVAATRLKHELFVSENRFRKLLDMLPVGVVLVETGGTYRFANPRFFEITGLTGELSTDKVIGAVHPDDRTRVRALGGAENGGKSISVDFRYLHEDGKTSWVQGQGVPLTDESGEPYARLGVVVDISEQKNLQNELTAARKAAEAASEAKSEFLANMSHEIRTPMNGVIGMTNILLDSGLTEHQRIVAKTIQSSADALLGLLNDILDFSKIEARKMEFDSVPFDLFKVLRETVDSHTFRSREKKLGLIAEIEATRGIWVRGDPGRFRQILTNLIGNAIKFTTEGGIEVEACLERETRERVGISLAVSDTGIGMTREELETLYERFVQADASTTRRFGGTGLGLAITRQLVNLLGGTIDVSSEPGRGTRFVVHLEFPREAARVLEAKSGTHRHFKGRVLVAEDNTINQVVARGILGKFGIKADIAQNGIEAVQALEQFRYDLVFMDCQMPICDGLEATRRIRAEDSRVLDRNVPIVALTANAMAKDLRACLEVGMNDHVTKPIEASRIAELLDRYLPRPESRAPDAPKSQATRVLETPRSAVFAPEELRSRIGNDEGLFRDVVSAFLNDTTTKVQRLLELGNRGEFDKARRLAHEIRGASATIGALRFAATLKAVELAQPDLLPSEVAVANDTYSELCRALDSELARTRSA